MTTGEASKTILRTLIEISKKEKEEAIRCQKYDDALIAGFLEGLFREVEKPPKST